MSIKPIRHGIIFHGRSIAAQWVMIPCEAEETGSELFDSPVLNPEVTGWGQVLSTHAALESGIAALLP
jgi:hypothetical protein